MNPLLIATLLAASPAYQESPTPPPAVGESVTFGPGLSIHLGRWHVRLLNQYWARFIGDTGRDLGPGPFREVIGQRARLGTHVRHEDGFAVRILFQDVRIWGEEPDTLMNFSAAGFDLQEAFVELPIPGGLTARVGRQEVVLENARLVGNVIWTLRARSFDGARIDGSWGDLGLMLFYAKVKERDQDPDGSVPDGVVSDVNLGVAHATFDFMKGQRVTLNYLVDALANGDRVRHTFGPTLHGKLAGVGYRLEGFVQLGTLNDENTASFLLAGNFSYRLGFLPWQPSIGLFVDVLSSDGTRAGTFDTLYATNHKFYGEMDFFLNLPVHTDGLGLINPGAQLKAHPLSWMTVMVTYHDFMGYKSDDALGRRFGDEIDFKVVLKMDWVQLRALYGLFIPGDLFQRRFAGPADDLEHFVYTTLAVEVP